MNCTPRSDTMFTETPISPKISLIKTIADGVFFNGRKWSICDRLSTITKIAVHSSDGESSTIKSIKIMFHGLSGTGSGFNNPHALLLAVLL